MPGGSFEDDFAIALVTRRSFLQRASAAGVAAFAGLALPPLPIAPSPSVKAPPLSSPLTDSVLQAFADTMIPGRRVARTESGAAVDPLAIAGVDARPGAVEADALALCHHPESGFDALTGEFISDLERRSLAVAGGEFLQLDFAARVRVCLDGLDFSNPLRMVWEAAAAMPFIAFCAATLVPEQTADKAVGYAVMGLPGRAPNGYSHFSYGRRLARERTISGSLP